MLTSVPLAPGEEWGQRWEFNTLVESRDIDFARATLPNVGGVTEMLKIMAMCDTHKVGIVPHFTGPVGTAAHIHTMTAFPGQVVMEYNYGGTPPPTSRSSSISATASAGRTTGRDWASRSIWRSSIR
jgi:galactonate dehydratase